ncbi:HD domain-containing protein [Candidatus Woesearchaeota archaeon]|nr:HD domain-containing protein [Candidatus Woesearchaeota archaeon]
MDEIQLPRTKEEYAHLIAARTHDYSIENDVVKELLDFAEKTPLLQLDSLDTRVNRYLNDYATPPPEEERGLFSEAGVMGGFLNRYFPGYQDRMTPDQQKLFAYAIKDVVGIHGHAKRDVGSLRSKHSLEVARMLFLDAEKGDGQTIVDYKTLIAALYHDVIEECGFKISEIKKRFDNCIDEHHLAITEQDVGDITRMITALSRTEEQDYFSYLNALEKKYSDHEITFDTYLRVMAIKLADRRHNITEMDDVQLRSVMLSNGVKKFVDYIKKGLFQSKGPQAHLYKEKVKHALQNPLRRTLEHWGINVFYEGPEKLKEIFKSFMMVDFINQQFGKQQHPFLYYLKDALVDSTLDRIDRQKAHIEYFHNQELYRINGFTRLYALFRGWHRLDNVVPADGAAPLHFLEDAMQRQDFGARYFRNELEDWLAIYGNMAVKDLADPQIRQKIASDFYHFFEMAFEIRNQYTTYQKKKKSTTPVPFSFYQWLADAYERATDGKGFTSQTHRDAGWSASGERFIFDGMFDQYYDMRKDEAERKRERRLLSNDKEMQYLQLIDLEQVLKTYKYNKTHVFQWAEKIAA